MDLKRCPDCSLNLPLVAYTKNRRNGDGLAFYCAVCARIRHTASRRRRFGQPKTRNGQGPKAIADGYKWCPECGEINMIAEFPRAPAQANGVGAYWKPCFNRIIVANRAKNHGSVRNYHLKHRYGINVDDFDAMFAEQDGVCAICREAAAEHVDHDHLSGRVRGLLCFNCNGALGQFRDRADLMMRAVLYLDREPGTPFIDPPSSGVSFYLGPVLDPRPDDEPRAA